MTTPDLHPHPYADLFPMISGEALAELVDDIKRVGLREPILITADDFILDGRNRLKACKLAGVEPRFTRYKGDDEDMLAYVLSRNLHRRHLSESQRAMVANKLAKLELGANQHGAEGSSIELPSQAEAAKALGVGLASVKRARVVEKKADPELVKAVEDGHLSVSAAKSILDAPADEQKKVAEAARTGDKKELKDAIASAASFSDPFSAPQPRDPVTGRTPKEQEKVDHDHAVRVSKRVREIVTYCAQGLSNPGLREEYVEIYLPETGSTHHWVVNYENIRAAGEALLDLADLWKEKRGEL